MTRSIRSIIGVTLLEIMLVLAIAGLIIVMSIRFYQSATSSSQIQSTLAAVQAISGAADSVSLGTSAGYANVTAANLTGVGGSGITISPFGGTITIGATTSSSYVVTIPGMSTSVCANVSAKLITNTKYSASCAATGLTFTYTSSS